MPLVVAGAARDSADEVRRAFVDLVRAGQPARDAIAGGLVLGESLEDVLRVLGSGGEISDETRDLGVVLVVRDGRVAVAHYVRPIERDAAGHLQRRPPAVLAARDRSTDSLDHFDWALSEELATRAGMKRVELEGELDARARALETGTITGDRTTAPGH